MRVGVITFATNSVLQIGVSANRTAILQTLNSVLRYSTLLEFVPYYCRLRTETGIAEAINLAQSTLVTAGRNAPRLIVVITGNSHLLCFLTPKKTVFQMFLRLMHEPSVP